MAKELWFSEEEFASRLARLREKMQAAGLDAVLAFEPESVTYLTGFFTNGYSSFQFAIITLEGEPLVVCRNMEEYYFDRTAAVGKAVCWADGDNKTDCAVKAIVQAVGNRKNVGIEMGTWQFPASLYLAFTAAMPQYQFSNIGSMISEMRLIKSPAEVAYMRIAGKAAEAGMQAAWDVAYAGKTERDIAAAVCGAMIKAGSDRPGPGVLSSGERALHLHGSFTDRVLELGDTVQLECCPCSHGYHARFMRTIKVESATDEEMERMEKIINIQNCALAEVKAGVPASVPDKIYRDMVLSEGLAETYDNKTFYSVGLLFSPNGGENLEAAPGCTWKFEAGMTFHTYMLMKGFGFSESILITETGFEKLTNFSRKLLISGK